MVTMQRLSIKMLMLRRLTTIPTKNPPYRHMFFDLNNPDLNPILNTLKIENHKILKTKPNKRLPKIEMHESHSINPFIFKKND